MVSEFTEVGDFHLFNPSKSTYRRLRRTVINSPIESRKNWMLWLFKSAGESNSNNHQYQFWQQDNHPIELVSTSFTKQKIDYLHENPVRAKLVDSAQRYVYSSAKDYSGECGLLPITILEEVFYGK
jgi:hypothetical protein